jgi:hypothetical protein
VDGVLREARERGDQYSLLMSRLGYCGMAWLAADDPDEARRQALGALAQPFPPTFTWPIYQGALAQTHIDLYQGDGAAGWRRMEEAWAALKAGGMLRLQPVRIEMRELRARCAISAASHPDCDATRRRRMLRFAAGEARRIAREDVQWVAPFVDALRAGIAATTGDPRAATEFLEKAALGFEHMEMSLHAAGARLRVATLVGGPEGSRLAAEPRAWMVDHGVQDPGRIAALFHPGPAA